MLITLLYKNLVLFWIRNYSVVLFAIIAWMYNKHTCIALAMCNVTKSVVLCFIVPKIRKHLSHIYFFNFFREQRVFVEIQAQLVQLEREEYVHLYIIYLTWHDCFPISQLEKKLTS